MYRVGTPTISPKMQYIITFHSEIAIFLFCCFLKQKPGEQHLCARSNNMNERIMIKIPQYR